MFWRVNIIGSKRTLFFLPLKKIWGTRMKNHIHGYFDDDGNEINPDLIPKPGLCITCKKDNISGKEEMLCTLTRADQQGDEEFHCEAYEPKDEQ